MDFLAKGTSIQLKDLDESKGIVIAYANTYNVKDTDGDISAPGSFEKSVSENFKRIKVLKDHNTKLVLGVPLAIDTKDPIGLLTTTQFNMKKSLSRDTFTDIQLAHENDLSSELSVGYKVMERDIKNKSIIKQYKLWEYSFMSTWGANQFSQVQGVKNLKSIPDTIDYLVKMYDLNYSDDRLKQVETLLKSLTSGPDPSTLDDKPMIEAIKSFTNSIK